MTPARAHANLPKPRRELVDWPDIANLVLWGIAFVSVVVLWAQDA